jgi:MarR family transcriptional regulator, organic hydroperoxide resistance regulator
MSNDATKTNDLLFGGSVWCNLDIALRNIDHIFRQHVRPDDLTVIEWYILRSLYEQDGQHASELARAVGRAATSFTPNLDKLQDKGYVERQPDETDRRAVRIYLTERGNHCRESVLASAETIDSKIADLFNGNEFEAFKLVLNQLQFVEAEAI